MNKLIKEDINDAGEKIYRMATFDIDVVAKINGGLSPTIMYLLNDKDITDDIRELRFYYKDPSSFIVDFPEFQTMLYQKEQKALNDLYDTISIRPKNMSTFKQILWSFGLMTAIIVPFLLIAIILK